MYLNPNIKLNLTAGYNIIPRFCWVTFQAENEKMPECLWLTPILQDSLRHIYQRFILESDGDVVEMVYKVIKTAAFKIYYM